MIPYDKRSGKIWYNDELVDWSDVKVHVLSHGLHYASCVFEGERVYDGSIFKLEEHTSRLFHSARRMGFEIPYSEDEINTASKKIISTQKVENGYVRPVAWRGSEMMAISAQQTKIHVAIATWEWGSYFDPKLKIEGIKLNISSWRRPLMLDHEGNIAEATGANIFFKDKNGELHTPIPDSFLDGITRRTVIEIAKSKNIKVNERKISPEELPNFVGCFLTGTAAEVTPVSCISKYQYKVCKTIIDLNESYQTLVKKKKAA